MKRFPSLKTKRLVLRELRHNDANALYQYLSKEAMGKYSIMKEVESIYGAQDLLNGYAENLKNGRGIRWGIVKRDTDQLVGTCGFEGWSEESNKADFSCEIACENWRKGYGSEAVERMIQYGFEEMNLVRIGAVVVPGNKPSIQLLQKLGFELEGELRHYLYHNGQPRNALIYSILPS